MAWHGMAWIGFTDRTLAHPLNCRSEVVVRLSAKCRARVLNPGLTHEGCVLSTRPYRPSAWYGMVWIVCMYITVITFFAYANIIKYLCSHAHDALVIKQPCKMQQGTHLPSCEGWDSSFTFERCCSLTQKRVVYLGDSDRDGRHLGFHDDFRVAIPKSSK